MQSLQAASQGSVEYIAGQYLHQSICCGMDDAAAASMQVKYVSDA